MKFKLIPTLFIALASMVLFSACSKKSNTEGRYIPKGAMLALVLNGASLSDKLPWEEVKSNTIFQEAYGDSSLDAFAKTAMDNPENTGIDIKKDMVIFVVKDSVGGYASIQGSIKDAAKFKAYHTASVKNATASQKDGIDFLTAERTTVSWNKDRFVMLIDFPEMSRMKDLQNDMPFDTTMTMPTPKPVVSTRNTVEAATAIYNLSEANSMAKDEQFSLLVNKKSDIYFWMNFENLFKDLQMPGGMAMMNMAKMYEGAKFAAAANFEDGKIDINIKSYAGKELTDVYKKYSGTKLDSDMTNRLPVKDVALFFAMNFKPEGIKEFLRVTGMEGLASIGLMQAGINIDDFVRANKGDIMLSVSDFSTDTLGKPKPKVMFATSIGDKASFDKLIAFGQRAGSGARAMDSEVSYNKNEKYFVIGNDKAANDAFIAGKATKPAFFDKIGDGPIAGFANFQYIMNAMQSEAGKDSIATEALKISQKIWDYATLSGGNFKEGGIEQHAEIYLMDKSTNSLKQLNRYMNELAVLHKKQKERERATGAISGIDTIPMIKIDTVKPGN
jgi:hypothetical protein